LKTTLIIFVMAFLAVTSTACFNKKVVPPLGKALVELDGPLSTSLRSNRGWVIAQGLVVNRGDKRADWLQVTIYTKDKATGVILKKKTTYVKGSGPNGKSLDPGKSASFEVRLDSKQNHRHEYEADVAWSEAL
ncbi:MAG: hypothetical protein IMF07_00770, partial [Proteobacteria bacterium]|nr:hypothetical protein [Pseudomonadota bacterium]